jgi:hypothetical protein
MLKCGCDPHVEWCPECRAELQRQEAESPMGKLKARVAELEAAQGLISDEVLTENATLRARVTELEEVCEMRKSASVLYKESAEGFRAERDRYKEDAESNYMGHLTNDEILAEAKARGIA